MSVRKKLVLSFIGINVALVLAAVLFFVLDRKTDGELFACSVLQNLHIYCPGCGFTRAVRAFLRLDIISSLRYNASVLVAVLVILYYEWRFFLSALRADFGVFKKSKTYPAIILAVSILAVFFVRNILLVGFGIDMIGDLKK